MTKIAYFTSIESRSTGLPICTWKMAYHFAHMPEYSVTLFVPRPGPITQGINVSKDHYQWFSLGFTRFRTPKHILDFLKFIWSFPFAFFRLVYILKKHNIDIIHFSDIIDAPFYPAAFFAKCKAISHLRQVFTSRVIATVYKTYTHLFCRKIIAVSQAVQRSITSKSSIVIYDPAPSPEHFCTTLAPALIPQIRPNTCTIMNTGNFRFVKGLHHCIEVAHILKASFPEKFQWIFIGSPVPGHEKYFKKCKDQITAYHLENDIIFIDTIAYESIPAYLKNAHIAVHFPAYQDAFPGIILEAMAMQIPIVSFDKGGIAEAYPDEFRKLCCIQNENYAAAAQIIARLVSDSLLYKNCTQVCFENLYSQFSEEQHFAQVKACYDEVLE